MVPQAQSFFFWGFGVQCLQQMVLSRLVHRDWCEILVGAPGLGGAHWVLDGAGLGSCLCSTLCDLGEVSYPLQFSAYSAEYGRVVIVGLLVVTELYTSSEPKTIQK